MNQVIAQCPICQNQLEVTRLYCRACDTTIEGHFALSTLHHLGGEQLAFLLTFIKNEGKINRVGEELGISYPTVRGRLHDLIRALGYEVGEEDEGVSDENRRDILEALSKGRLSSDEALKRLAGRS